MADRGLAASRTRSAIKAAHAGEFADARKLLAEALSADRDYVLAWLWFAAVTDDGPEQLYCLREAQRLRPDSSTDQVTARLSRDHSPQAPPELLVLVDPEPPELVSSLRADALVRRRHRRMVLWGALAACLLLMAGVAFYANLDRRETVHLAVVAGNQPGGGPGSGQEIQSAARWAAEVLNETDRLPVRVEITYFNDGDDPVRAIQVAEQIVADGGFLGVIGHGTSATSLAAGPVYQGAGIPAITPVATADSVTSGNPWFFRSVFDNRSQGEGVSDYASALLGGGTTMVIATADPYGSTLAKGFKTAYEQSGGKVQVMAVRVDSTGSPDPAIVKGIAARLKQNPVTGPIFVATGARVGSKLVKSLRAAGIGNTILAADSMSDIGFYQSLVTKPEPLTARATAAVISATPLVRAGLSGEAVLFYEQFSTVHGYLASWAAGLTYDAFDVLVEAMARSGAKLARNTRGADRRAIRDAMDAARTPETAFPGLTRLIFFDDNGSAVRPVAMETGSAGQDGTVRMVAADRQLVEYSPEAGLSVADAIRAGIAVQTGDRIYTVQRIVDVGVNLNELSDLNTSNGTYKADFFLWLKYPGSDDAAAIQFANAVDPKLALGAPVRTSKTVDGRTYQLYRLSGAFKSAMEFSDFPFDTQQLKIAIQNVSLSSARIAYTPDPELLEQPQAERLQSGVDASATVANMPNWRADQVLFYPSAVGNTSNLGEPRTIAGPAGVTYSQFLSDVLIARDVRSFLVKSLLPLALLVLITFISLWLPFTEGNRVSFAVTGVLTGAVMLGTVTSSLANVDYTVAIAWAYYGFIALSGVMLLLTLIGRYFTQTRRLAAARKVDVFARIFYAGFVLLVIGSYAVIYG